MVYLATAAFLLASWALPVRDQPLGTDWFVYLKNAVALAHGPLSDYDRWRPPMHAWACLAASRPLGGLLEGSQAVSALSLAALLPLTWWLGRAVVGGVPAVLAVLLLAGSPDLLLFTRSSTPYPLFTFLLALGFAALLAAWEREAVRWGGAAGVLLGLALATDVRGSAYVLTVIGAVACAGVNRLGWRDRRTRVIVTAALATAATHILVGLLTPVSILPLSEQVILQRNLHHAAFPGLCGDPISTVPTPAEWVSACGRATLRMNWERVAAAVPISLSVIVALGVVGWGTAGRRGERRSWVLALPILALLPSVPLVGLQHRHVLALAPFAALSLAAGAWSVVRWTGIHVFRQRMSAHATVAVAIVLALAFAALWHRLPGTPLHRARTGIMTAGHASSANLADSTGMIDVRRLLRTDGRAADRVVDCARGGLRMRLYPSIVEEGGVGPGGRASLACRRMLAIHSLLDHPNSHTWLLTEVRPGDVVAGDWSVISTMPRGTGTLTLFRR